MATSDTEEKKKLETLIKMIRRKPTNDKPDYIQNLVLAFIDKGNIETTPANLVATVFNAADDNTDITAKMVAGLDAGGWDFFSNLGMAIRDFAAQKNKEGYSDAQIEKSLLSIFVYDAGIKVKHRDEHGFYDRDEGGVGDKFRREIVSMVLRSPAPGTKGLIKTILKKSLELEAKKEAVLAKETKNSAKNSEPNNFDSATLTILSSIKEARRLGLKEIANAAKKLLDCHIVQTMPDWKNPTRLRTLTAKLNSAMQNATVEKPQFMFMIDTIREAFKTYRDAS